MNASWVTEQWQEVLTDMDAAARRTGRAPESIRLVAVSKLHPADAVRELHAAGQMEFGENYVQEAVAKMEALSPEIRWHFIGHLQTNKVRLVVGRFALVHGVDSLKLAQSLQDCAKRRNLTQDVLVQVNLAREPQKSGIAEVDLPALAEFLTECSHLRWQGLMLMPPFFDAPELARPYFARLREVAERLRQTTGLSLPELSMGMTGDFEAAIEEGATMVRVGTRIFGERA